MNLVEELRKPIDVDGECGNTEVLNRLGLDYVCYEMKDCVQCQEMVCNRIADMIDKYYELKPLEVFDADGVLINKGDILYSIHNNKDTYEVLDVDRLEEFEPDGCVLIDTTHKGWWRANLLTHVKPLLDANNKRICIGDSLYNIESGYRVVVEEIDVDAGCFYACCGWDYLPHQFIHKEPDTQDKLDEDVLKYAEILSEHIDRNEMGFGEILFDIQKLIDRQRELCKKM